MVTNFLKNTIEKIRNNRQTISFLDQELMDSLDGVPNILQWGIVLVSKKTKQISKLEKENKKLEKQIKKHIKKGYHKAEPGIATYKEWCHYMHCRQWLTKEDLEFENTLRTKYKMEKNYNKKNKKENYLDIFSQQQQKKIFREWKKNLEGEKDDKKRKA